MSYNLSFPLAGHRAGAKRGHHQAPDCSDHEGRGRHWQADWAARQGELIRGGMMGGSSTDKWCDDVAVQRDDDDEDLEGLEGEEGEEETDVLRDAPTGDRDVSAFVGFNPMEFIEGEVGLRCLRRGLFGRG
jgi:hypothetical protein